MSDQDYQQRKILMQAAELNVLNGVEFPDAIKQAEALEAKREAAEQTDQVVRDEQGSAVEYLDDSLNRPSVSPDQEAMIRKEYRHLCSQDGIDP